MAQRLRSCSKTTNLDTINCQSYLTCLSKDKQHCGQRCPRPRERLLSNSKPSLVVIPPTPPNLKLRPGSIKQHNILSTKTQSSPSNVVHKEVIGDNSALVEVTVRTKANRKSRNSASGYQNNQRRPWSDLLQNNECVSSFSGCDPLRTLHFLGRELNAALKSNNKTKDACVSKIVGEMMDTLNRVPLEIAGTIQTRESNTRGKNDVPERLNNVLHSPRRQHKVCQTLIDSALFVKTENIQKQLEDSIKELDQKCKEMEHLCKSWQMENQQLERLLISEKDTVKFLRSQMEDLHTDRVTSESSTLSQMTKENNILHTQIKSLQQQIDSQVLLISELKNQLEDVQKQKHVLENENITLHHNKTISKLEKEKHLAILSTRDRQIKEILVEMNRLQEVVNDELLQFQKNPLLSQPSSQSTVIGNWQQIQNEVTKVNYRNEMGDNAQVVFPSDTIVNQLFSMGNTSEVHTFFELPSYDSSTSNNDSSDSKSKKVLDTEVPSNLISVYQH